LGEDVSAAAAVAAVGEAEGVSGVCLLVGELILDYLNLLVLVIFGGSRIQATIYPLQSDDNTARNVLLGFIKSSIISQ